MNIKRALLARAAMLLLLLAVVCVSVQADNKIVVVSDIHVMAPSLLPAGAETTEAWTTYYAGQRKMLQQSAAIFDQFVTNVISQKPKAVLITGDLTKDGEYVSHQYVRNGLQRLQNAGIKVFVIPGNHDFGGEGNHTKFNTDGTTMTVDALAYSNFATFYNGYGYGEASSEYDSNSLSYMAEPMDGLALLAIDSHSATVSQETLDWLVEKAKAARNAGKQVIAMMPHPLFPHITGGDMYISTYAVNSHETVRDALIEAGVNTILTGHFHTSDIAKDWKDEEATAVYDINTGSLVSYPCDYRVLTPSANLKTLDVKTASIVPNGMTADKCKEWLHDRMKVIITKVMKEKAETVAPFLVPYIATQIDNLAEYAANLFVLHAEGDENKSADRAALATTYTNYKKDATYSTLLDYGGITDASIYSILDDLSNYGTTKENQTPDRSLVIPLPEVVAVKGDANGDGKVTITDAVAIVNYILGNPSGNFNVEAANVNNDYDDDGKPNITITDAVGVVNIILNSGGASAPAFDSSKVEAPEATEPE